MLFASWPLIIQFNRCSLGFSKARCLFTNQVSFFLSSPSLSLSLHSLINKKENEVASVVNTFLVVYSRYLFILTKVFSVSCSVFLDLRSSDFVFFFNLCFLAESIVQKLCVKCASFSVCSLFSCFFFGFLYIYTNMYESDITNSWCFTSGQNLTIVLWDMLNMTWRML